MFRNVEAEPMRRTRHDVWKYFEYSERKDKASCTVDFCSAVFSGKKTTHLKRHLQRKHPLIAATLPQEGVRSSERGTPDPPGPPLPNVVTEALRRKFKKKLKSIVESLLKSTVSEATNAFDVFTFEHEIVVKQKMDECSMLRLKLEVAEKKLREQDRKRGVREDVTQASGQTIPEITVDVPDDWCAPLGCENVMDQSPSTSSEALGDRSSSLCSLSVALWRLPDIKQEAQDDGYQRDSSLSCAYSNEGPQSNRERTEGPRKPLSTTKHGGSRPAKATRDPKESMKPKPKKQLRSNDRPSSKEKVKMAAPTTDKGSSMKRTMPAIKVEPELMEDQHSKEYRCKFCYKVFHTEVGRSIHVRTHKKCVDCQKMFRYPSNLRAHRKSCAKLHKASSPEIRTLSLRKRPPPQETTSNSPVVNQHTNRKRRAQKRSKSQPYTVQRRDKSFYCVNCHRSFCSIVWLRNHISKNLPCSKCPKKFCTKQFLQRHIYEVHTLNLKEGLEPSQAVDMEFAAVTSDEKPSKPSTVPSKEKHSDSEAVSSKENQSKLDTVSSKEKQRQLSTVSSKEKHSDSEAVSSKETVLSYLTTVSSKEKHSDSEAVSSKEKWSKLDPVSSKEKQSKPSAVSSKENVGELRGISPKEMQSKLSTVSSKETSMELGAVSSKEKLSEFGAIPSNMKPIDVGAVSCTVKQSESVSVSSTVKQIESVSVSPTVKQSDLGAVSAYVKQIESFSVSPKEKLTCEESETVLG